MTTNTDHIGSDAELVGRCLGGDRQAFHVVVTRYQGLICALAYSGCGDLHRSEDLAQDTFLQAWKHMVELKDPGKLRAWLCGIARNLILRQRREQSARPAAGQWEEASLPADEPTPPEQAITHEEETLLWQTLSGLPEEYREPMVLYYRQEESIAAIASALDISEEAARQRLSRGRAMLAADIERLICRGLRSSVPTKAFATAVIAALPGVAYSATAASAGAMAVKGSASAKAAAMAAAMAGSILGPLIGLGGGYLGLKQANPPALWRATRL